MEILKAPQETLHPEPWSYIYAPGEFKLYSDLLLPEFCAGNLAILQQNVDRKHSAALLRHFLYLMVLASTYQWSEVRAYHLEILRLFGFGCSGDFLDIDFRNVPALKFPENPKRPSIKPRNHRASIQNPTLLILLARQIYRAINFR